MHSVYVCVLDGLTFARWEIFICIIRRRTKTHTVYAYGHMVFSKLFNFSINHTNFLLQKTKKSSKKIISNIQMKKLWNVKNEKINQIQCVLLLFHINGCHLRCIVLLTVLEILFIHMVLALSSSLCSREFWHENINHIKTVFFVGLLLLFSNNYYRK